MTVYEILTIASDRRAGGRDDSGDLSRSTELDRRLLRRPVCGVPPPDVLVGQAAQQSCPHCRHPVLTHPLYAMHHPGSTSQVRVVGDRLHY